MLRIAISEQTQNTPPRLTRASSRYHKADLQGAITVAAARSLRTGRFAYIAPTARGYRIEREAPPFGGYYAVLADDQTTTVTTYAEDFAR